DRSGLRGHQPRGHLRAALLSDRGAAEGETRDPGRPRRPAWDRGRGDGGAAERGQAHGPLASAAERPRDRSAPGLHRGPERPTGCSDYPNQINNVLCFPGIFRGALDVRAPAITESMKMAAAHAIADIVEESELREDYIIPSVFNRDVAPAVAAAVAREARADGTARAGQEVGFAHGDTITGGSPAPLDGHG